MDGCTDVKYMYKCVKGNEEARVLKRLKMYFSVVLKEEAIVRNTTPSGI